jgi:hypothetical protein
VGCPQYVDSLPCQPAEEPDAGFAGARHLGQVQDEGPPGAITGIVQKGDPVVAESSSDADGREVRRVGHDQPKHYRLQISS